MADDILRDPSTGRPIQFNVPPPTMGGGMESIDPAAIARAYQTQKIADAEKAVAAAIQFQGLRGYQQALQSGEPAAKALTRYGPMMFYQNPAAFGPAVRAVTPPQMTPFQQATLDARKAAAAKPQIRSIPGGGFVSINPTNQAITTVRQPTTKDNRTFSAVVAPRRIPTMPDTRLSMTGEEFSNFMQTAPPQLRTNAVNTAISRMITPPAAPTATATNAPVKTKRLRYNPKTGEFE